MPKLTAKLKKAQEERQKSLWEGPSSDGPNGGITQSMLNNFLVCRERFRVKYVLGLQPQDTFSHRLEYGSMWHYCEEGLAANDPNPWKKLDEYTVKLCERYPLQQQEILHWHDICQLQFPIYVEHWSNHEDVKDRTPLLQEEVFNVPYTLPSGHTVRLRGKFDSVDLIGRQIWLQENKTKGDIDPILMQRQLTFDLQTGFYLTALECEKITYFKGGNNPINKIGGVRYNVIRRPLSGGKGSIKQKKGSKNIAAESDEEFYERLAETIRGATGPEWDVNEGDHYFFMRWKVTVTPQDIEVFKIQFLNPILQQLCDWWEYIKDCDGDPWSQPYAPHGSPHFRTPYGIYSPLYDGKPTDQDEFLATGSTVGLRRADNLFQELK